MSITTKDLMEWHPESYKQFEIPIQGPPPNPPKYDMRHPVSHTRDPDTSKAVERSMTDSGKRKSNNQRVAWLVARYPGKTASELTAEYLKMWVECGVISFDKMIVEVRRRLSDMNGIHVRRGEKHEARIGLLKNKESIWWPK